MVGYTKSITTHSIVQEYFVGRLDHAAVDNLHHIWPELVIRYF